MIEDKDRLRSDRVFIDASVFRALQFDWHGKWLTALLGLVNRGLVRVVTTETTKREVCKLMREAYVEAYGNVRKSSVTLRLLGHGDTMRALADQEACCAKMDAGFEAWLKRARAFTASKAATLDTIMDDYFAGAAPFDAGRKKSEFPDAVIIADLKAWCAQFKSNMYVISCDGDMHSCCSPGGPLIHAASVGEVISHGVATAAIHDALLKALQNNDAFIDELSEQVAGARVHAEGGYRRWGEQVEVDADVAKLEEFNVDGVQIESFDGVTVVGYAQITLIISSLVAADGQGTQHSEFDDYPGSHSVQRVSSANKVTVTVSGIVDDKGNFGLSAELTKLDDDSLWISWDDIDRQT